MNRDFWCGKRIFLTGQNSISKCDPCLRTGVTYVSSLYTRAGIADKAMEWHAAWRHDEDMRAVSLAQIADYAAQKPVS